MILPTTQGSAGTKYSSSPLFHGDMFQDPQEMPRTVVSAEPYMYCVFSYTYIPIIKFN